MEKLRPAQRLGPSEAFVCDDRNFPLRSVVESAVSKSPRAGREGGWLYNCPAGCSRTKTERPSVELATAHSGLVQHTSYLLRTTQGTLSSLLITTMVLDSGEVSLRKVGSCERITMKLRNILSLTRLGCSRRKPVEDAPREFHRLYKIDSVIGKGGFGTVFSATRKKDKMQVAVKEVYKAKIIKKTADGKTPLEVALMEQVQDVVGVIRIIDFFEMPESFFIVMEKFHCQDLFDYISERGALTEEKAKNIFKQLLETVLMCHNNGVLHRDIKDENILIDVKTEKIKLIDFGSATYLHDGLYNDFEGNYNYRRKYPVQVQYPLCPLNDPMI